MKNNQNNNKFIGTFVNEMYAILLGIGIGNILFVHKLDTSNIFEVVMGLFVTSVVLIYWWDWTEFINDNVVTSKREFVVDFSILIVLEVLYLFYNEPQKLIVAFILLACLDFLWVLNFILCKSDNNSVNSKKWILEKILGIVIMTVVWAGLKYFNNAPILLQGLSIIIGFIAIRFISFKQLTMITNYELCKATESDYSSICLINNSHLNPKGKESFIISKLDLSTIEEKLSQNHSFYILKNHIENLTVGFIELSNSVDKDILRKVSWKSNKYKEQLMAQMENVKYIEKVAIHKDYMKQGIGRVIYNSLFSRLHDYSFYSFIMVSPYNNDGSQKFHAKMKFKIVGDFNSPEYAGYKNYKSILCYYTNK